MKPFSREPLKEFIEKSKHKKPPVKKHKEDSVEDIIFSLIVSVFFIGVILFSGQEPTGLVSYDTNTEIININTLYNESTNLTFVLEGIPTSLRVTGSFIGDGSGLIFLDPFIAVEKDQLPVSGGMAITGFVVFENEINESVVENVTVEINETIEVNLTVNITENITIIPNITLNVSENITEINITEINITQNITENVTVNETIVPNVTIELELSEFDEYCLETCFLNDITSEITLQIILDNVFLNISHITYTYEFEEEIIDIIPPYIPPTENITIENVTTNVTAINVTINETLNISINETNITLNFTDINLTINITELNITNITEINLTNITIELNVSNITVIEPLTEFELFNTSLKSQGLLLLGYTQILDVYDVTLGLDKNNLVKLSVDKLSDVDIDFYDFNDTRLNSKVVRIGENIERAEISLTTDSVDGILQCVQFTNETCKKWVITSIPYLLQNNLSKFTVTEPGIYSAVALNSIKKEYIPTNSVYYNSNCEKCVQTEYCNFRGFCAVQNHIHGYDFEGQLDFDILNLDDSFEKAEVCGYLYNGREDIVINYVKYSPESFCSDIRLGNSSSNLINFGYVNGKGWTCIDATEIIDYAKTENYSNVFITWQGQDLGGEKFPISCYRGITDLSQCEGYNPSGADDCRPYLRIEYK